MRICHQCVRVRCLVATLASRSKGGKAVQHSWGLLKQGCCHDCAHLGPEEEPVAENLLQRPLPLNYLLAWSGLLRIYAYCMDMKNTTPEDALCIFVLHPNVTPSHLIELHGTHSARAGHQEVAATGGPCAGGHLQATALLTLKHLHLRS